jgi:hypothetical protein
VTHCIIDRRALLAVLGVLLCSWRSEVSLAQPLFQRTSDAERLTTAAGVNLDYFGSSVAVSGDRILVGAPRTFPSFAVMSSAYVFRYEDNQWVEEQKLTGTEGLRNDHFGSSVCLSGKWAFVAATQAQGGERAAVYAFRRDGSLWVQEQRLIATDGEGDNDFGRSIAASGDWLLIGAPNLRAAYLFREHDGRWVQQRKLQEGAMGVPDFGNSVALEGNRALIGAPERGMIPGYGAAYVFRCDGKDWVEEQRLTAEHGRRDDRFGWSVSLSGDTALVGAPEASAGRGSVYVFRRTGDRWQQEQALTQEERHSFGSSLCVLGTNAVIAADGQQGHRHEAGFVSVYRFEGTQWVLAKRLFASEGPDGDHFGDCVALGESLVLVGAPHRHVGDEEGLDEYRGAAYVFR